MMQSRSCFKRMIDRTGSLTRYGVSAQEVGPGISVTEPGDLVITYPTQGVSGMEHRSQMKGESGWMSWAHSLATEKRTEPQGSGSQSGSQTPSPKPYGSTILIGSNAWPPLALSHRTADKYRGPRARRPEAGHGRPSSADSSLCSSFLSLSLITLQAPPGGRGGGGGGQSLAITAVMPASCPRHPAPGGPAPLWFCQNNIWGSSDSLRAPCFLSGR